MPALCVQIAQVFILYDCFVTPMLLSFDEFAEPLTLAMLATIFWTLEMLSSFSTAYHKEDSLLVTNRCLIALRHLRTWFIVDALTLGPDYLERLSRAGLLDDATSDLGLGAPHMLRLVRGGRFLRLFRLLRMLRLAKLQKFTGEIFGKISVELARYEGWLRVLATLGFMQLSFSLCFLIASENGVANVYFV